MSEATPVPPQPRPRWRPRFSLRTLLLASLLCGSGMLLWRNRAPWAVKYTIQEDRGIANAEFSPNDKYLYIQTSVLRTENQPVAEWKEFVKIYDTETGRLYRTITSVRHDQGEGDYSFSPAGAYFKRVSHGTGAQPDYCELWALDSGQPIRFENQKPEEFHIEQISSGDHFALIWKRTLSILVKLPSLDVVASRPCEGSGVFSSDEKWLALNGQYYDDPVFMISTESGAIKRLLDADDDWFQFSPDGQYFAFPTQNRTIKFIELSTGNTVSEFNIGNSIGEIAFSPDGNYLMVWKHGVTLYSIVDWRTNNVLFSEKHDRYPYSDVLFLTNNKLCRSRPLAARSLPCGKVLWQNLHRGKFHSSGEYAFDEETHYLLFGDTGSTAFDFGNNPSDDDVADFELEFAKKHREFLTYEIGPQTPSVDARYKQVQVWHRRRPEFWYGFAWLPEFWLTVILAGALLWSISRPLK